MVTWGRIEHRENVALMTHYDEEIKRLQVDPAKGEWNEADRRMLGLSRGFLLRHAMRSVSSPKLPPFTRFSREDKSLWRCRIRATNMTGRKSWQRLKVFTLSLANCSNNTSQSQE